MEETLAKEWPYNTIKTNGGIHVQNDVLSDNKKTRAPKSVLRTANILTCLSNGINSITDIARVCKTNKSTVHRLLQALGETGLTIQDPVNHRYYIGPVITQIASNPYVTHEHLVSCSINEMRYLSNLTGESIGLSVLIGLQYVILYEIGSIYDFAITAKRRISGNIHAGAPSKAMLSQLNNRELNIVLTNLVLEPLTERTLTDKEELLAELKKVRRQGYAISCGEINPGAMCISAPIRNYVLPAALNVVGPESRIKPKETDFISELIASNNRVCNNLVQVFKIKR